MATLKVTFDAGAKTATVRPLAAAVPAGSVNWGTFVHDEVSDKLGATAPGINSPVTENHVLFQHVRDLAYKAGHLDMQIIKIAVA